MAPAGRAVVVTVGWRQEGHDHSAAVGSAAPGDAVGRPDAVHGDEVRDSGRRRLRIPCGTAIRCLQDVRPANGGADRGAEAGDRGQRGRAERVAQVVPLGAAVPGRQDRGTDGHTVRVARTGDSVEGGDSRWHGFVRPVGAAIRRADDGGTSRCRAERNTGQRIRTGDRRQADDVAGNGLGGPVRSAIRGTDDARRSGRANSLLGKPKSLGRPRRRSSRSRSEESPRSSLRHRSTCR